MALFPNKIFRGRLVIDHHAAFHPFHFHSVPVTFNIFCVWTPLVDSTKLTEWLTVSEKNTFDSLCCPFILTVDCTWSHMSIDQWQ